MIAALVCFTWYFCYDYLNLGGNKIKEHLTTLEAEEDEEIELVSNDKFSMENSPELQSAVAAQPKKKQTNEQTASAVPEILEEYRPIQKENSDFAGWIQIEGTHVDYPVMQKVDHVDYYLNRDFYGAENLNGTLFMDARTNLIDRSTNIIIYGHNMKSGQMFGDLKKYLDQDFFEQHRTVKFDTIYAKGTYEIFAVCRAKVRYQDEEGFRYYDFIDAQNEASYQEFMDYIEQVSVFADSKLPSYGEELLTLSTCNNYVEGGRLFLVARKVSGAE